MAIYHGIDLFSGAGGMSVGAIKAGIDVKLAVEIDKFAGLTFKANHPKTSLFNDDVRKFQPVRDKTNAVKVLFGGPPCQGFSTSNQKTRNKVNPTNWLFKEYLRVVKSVIPDWVIVENVKGLVETEQGYFFNLIIEQLNALGYTITYDVLNAADFGIPQLRNRVFIVGSLHGIHYEFPKATHVKYITVEDAISDLPVLTNGAGFHELEYNSSPKGYYQKLLRKGSKKAVNNLVTRNNETVLTRYKHIPPGGNWENIPASLMENYKDYTRCHTGIYHRLRQDTPSAVLGNYRKNMLIHPTQNRGLSVREAARIQSFPDTFHFHGSIGFQQQQVGNSVPPLLAEAIFKKITSYSL
ncbi:DNA cytosine methyltransferase [Mucilaginibacter sp. UYCu711]|uniref:DNA cytosine methyltransferase n=1 Tax=Mucilaginibacter sp. UYCu711 TaxID=3156339 RepID=UPI003D1A3C8B